MSKRLPCQDLINIKAIHDYVAFFKCSDFQPHYIFVLTVHFAQTDPFQSYVATVLISTELARA